MLLPLQKSEALPALFRWTLGFPASPLSLAMGLGLLSGVGTIVSFGVDYAPPGIWDAVVYALYVAWIPLALVGLVRGTARDAADLAPALSLDVGSLCDRVFTAGARALPWSVPVALGMAGADLLMMTREGFLEMRFAVVAFCVVRELIVCLGMFGVLGWAAGAAWSLSREAQANAHPDLLDARSLAPLSRCGTRMLLFWVLAISLSFPYMVLSIDVSAESLRFLALACVFMLALAAAALGIPTWGARQALRGAKLAELGRVREQIRDAREARDDIRLPGLLAWEARVESAPEWPIDARSLRLTGLYVLIPVFSWVGGALVERVVDAVVG